MKLKIHYSRCQIIDDTEVDIDSIVSDAKSMYKNQGWFKIIKPHLGKCISKPYCLACSWTLYGKIQLYPNAIQAVRYAIQLEQTATAWHNLAKIYVACSDNNEATNS